LISIIFAMRVLSNPSRDYGGVQWVFSRLVHCLATNSTHCEPMDTG
jgi:hypothetical protein